MTMSFRKDGALRYIEEFRISGHEQTTCGVASDIARHPVRLKPPATKVYLDVRSNPKQGAEED